MFIRDIIKEINERKIKRAYPPKIAINQVGTGNVSIQAYGVQTRTVQMSRGGREGNNAFLNEPTIFLENIHTVLNGPQLNLMLFRSDVSTKTFDLLRSLIPNYDNMLCLLVGECVRTGNLKLSSYLMSLAVKNNGFGFNQLHDEVLKDGPLTPFKKVSVTKKPIMNYQVAPLHAACINPNTNHLKELIAQCDDLGYQDMEGRKVIHYAAACTSAEPLKILLDHGANSNDLTRTKLSPLMIAAMYNRCQCALVLIQKGVNVSLKDRKGYAAVHYAAENGNLEMIKLLIDNGANPNQPGPDRKVPIMLAAANGHFECVFELIEKDAKVLRRDKCRRTALTLAIKNGQAKVASLLLERGSDYNDPDSSKNYPIHYAAAYGWIECIDLLIEAGADINAQNDWKLQPLLVAMLMGQTGCVDRLLKEANCDVNCKDEQGRTLLSQAIEMLSKETLQQIKFLLKEKGADPNVADQNGLTPLHYLCKKGKPICPYQEMSLDDKKKWEEDA